MLSRTYFIFVAKLPMLRIPPQTRVTTGPDRTCGQNSSETLARLDVFRDNLSIFSRDVPIKYDLNEIKLYPVAYMGRLYSRMDQDCEGDPPYRSIQLGSDTRPKGMGDGQQDCRIYRNLFSTHGFPLRGRI